LQTGKIALFLFCLLKWRKKQCVPICMTTLVTQKRKNERLLLACLPSAQRLAAGDNAGRTPVAKFISNPPPAGSFFQPPAFRQ
jgi:hypothetical protein